MIVPTNAASGFRLDIAQLENTITPRTRLLVLNTPGNPTGRVSSLAELKALAALPSSSPGAGDER